MSRPDIKFNFKRSPADPRDHLVKLNIPLHGLSQIVDLSPNCTSIKDQGQIGACTAFASIGTMEYVAKKFMGSKIEDLLSERFTYYISRETTGIQPTDDSGAYLRDVIKTLAKQGTCLEKTCPYLPNDVKTTLTSKPSSQAYDEAKNYEILNYANIPEDANCLVTMKGVISKGYPVIGGFTCYENLWDGVGGQIPLPKGQIVGGHAVCIIGFDDTKQMFKFKNSWGVAWGDNGYGYLPYYYLLSKNLYDLWVIYTEENGSIAVNPSAKKDDINNRIVKILTAVNPADLKSAADYAKLQQTITSSIINNPDTLDPRTKQSLLLFVQRILADVQLVQTMTKFN